jgi:hypothetical protein
MVKDTSPLESVIQKQILDYLKLKQVLCFKHRNVGIYKRSTDRYIPLPEEEVGISDIIGCLPKSGRLFAIEVKRPGKAPTPAQQNFLNKVSASGGLAMWATSLEEVITDLAPFI